jgi:hypothetical protein
MFSSDQIDWGRMGWGALIPGVPLFVAGAGMGIAHYVFKMPIHQGHGNGALASSNLILATTLAFVSGGTLAIGLGICLISASRKRVR